MDNNALKELCLELMRADSEEEIISILKRVGYWENNACWRYYGDNENNYSTIGNQQSSSDAALVEKITNSIDSRLILECMRLGIDPESSQAPQSIKEAVAKFFEGGEGITASSTGRVSEWPSGKQMEVAQSLTVAATGFLPAHGCPSFTITDQGEGQSPSMLPQTILSLAKSNKLRIPFVQGKFNMGGSGALVFCGKRNFQFILSKRNPDATHSGLEDENKWGFTIVRREDPAEGRRSSVYTYLAPVNAEDQPKRGSVLSFEADSLPILPNKNDAYSRKADSGTLIKLYEYQPPTSAGKSNILMKSGMLHRIDLLLPECALPVRMHECRAGYSGSSGSFDTTVTGLINRLDADRRNNIEDEFPLSCPFRVNGQEMNATIYAFKKGKGEAYKKNEGVIFVINGQTQGILPSDFFRRKSVGLSYIRDSLLVTIDCTKIDGRSREDLFMNSRDRLVSGGLRTAIETQLEIILRSSAELKRLAARRRQEEVESRLKDNKPLEDILSKLLKHSPTLSTLFLLGERIKNPFKQEQTGQQEKTFIGKEYPTFFKYLGKDYGYIYEKICHIDSRARLKFETDANNDYLSPGGKGTSSLYQVLGGERVPVLDAIGPSLSNGVGSLQLGLPGEPIVGDRFEFELVVTDDTQLEPFTNKFVLTSMPAASPDTRKKPRGKRLDPPDPKKEGKDRDNPQGIQLPNIIPVREEHWGEHVPPFDRNTAVRVRSVPVEVESKQDSLTYDFMVNVDNIYLKSEMKSSKESANLLEAKFMYGLVLIGMGLIKADSSPDSTVDDQNGIEINIEDHVERVTKAVAPIILPMIDSLGGILPEDIESADLSESEDAA